MELASECMSLLALPQTDSSEEAQTLPRGPNRSAAFATNAEQYFHTLNVSIYIFLIAVNMASEAVLL